MAWLRARRCSAPTRWSSGAASARPAPDRPTRSAAARLLRTVGAAQGLFAASVRLGLPTGFGGLSDRLSGPSFATAVGLVRWGSILAGGPSNGNGRHNSNGHGNGNLTSAYAKTVRW